MSFETQLVTNKPRHLLATLNIENRSYPLYLQLQTHADNMGSRVNAQASEPRMLIDGEVRESFLVISWSVPQMVTHFPSLTQQQASKLQMVRIHNDIFESLC
jgi:hypothetical protein